MIWNVLSVPIIHYRMWFLRFSRICRCFSRCSSEAKPNAKCFFSYFILSTAWKYFNFNEILTETIDHRENVSHFGYSTCLTSWFLFSTEKIEIKFRLQFDLLLKILSGGLLKPKRTSNGSYIKSENKDKYSKGKIFLWKITVHE